MRKLTLGLLLLAAFVGPALAQRESLPSTPGQFDYYLLSLSWSPQYCSNVDDDANDPQCAAGRNLGFVVHGLWPENQNGINPRNCKPAPQLDQQVAKSMLDIMPSDKLVAHEWLNHGTCSGVSSADFFKRTRDAFLKLKVPAQYQKPAKPLLVPVKEFEQALVDANPGLKSGQFAIYCDERYLREVRVCMDKNLNFRTCGERVKDSCGLAKMVLRPVK